MPALTGAIMCMGVATANSVLVISFARERLDALGDATAAAIEAGLVRCRPVVMTALAMMIGMVPMSLGLGEGGEQNAPLGRAVIGGPDLRHHFHPSFSFLSFSVSCTASTARSTRRAPVVGGLHVA